MTLIPNLASQVSAPGEGLCVCVTVCACCSLRAYLFPRSVYVLVLLLLSSPPRVASLLWASCHLGIRQGFLFQGMKGDAQLAQEQKEGGLGRGVLFVPNP